MKKHITLIAIILFTINVLGQNASLEGKVVNAISNEPIPFANIIIFGTNIGSVTDLDGNFKFFGLEPGFVKLAVSSIGYETKISDEIMVTNSKLAFIQIEIEETSTELEEIKIVASPFRKKEESPVSMRSIGISEIEKNPGGNRDISRVIQSFPGVSSSVSFRNDIIVRGGGSSENRFYLDGVEIPTINHFSTQGSSGGPVGIINVDFVREVDFYSGAFPANRGNALSSVMDFRQIDGNQEKFKYKGAFGASDLAFTVDGPIGEKTSIIASARRSYLQFLFQAIGLPFLPIYNDFQFKSRTRIDEKNEITIIGLGAIDDFELNLDANETEEQQYILDYLPVQVQRNYTLGLVYKHFREKSYDTYVVSRSYLNNKSWKYQNNIEVDSLQIFDYKSVEAENKFRFERTSRLTKGYKLNFGTNLEYATYTNQTFNKVFVNNQPFTINYNTDLNVVKYGLFGQISKSYLNKRLILSFGLRLDGNNYSENMSNPLNQLSPRISASYAITQQVYLNFNTGRYFQMPAYTTLGFKDNAGEYVNKENNLKYIKSDHIVGGIEYRPNDQSKFTIEGFYKHYNNYPFSVNDSIALSSKGADFGTYGDEEVKSISEGRAFGLEVLARHRDILGFNLVFAYTFVSSEFKDYYGEYIPSAWDNKHLITITTRRTFKNNWDFGFKWRFVGGAPYTPYDENKSSLITAWDAQGQPYLDFNRFNSERYKAFHYLDVRIDKMYYLKNLTLNFYLDIQNLYNFKTETIDPLILQRDENGNPLIDPNDNNRYLLKRLESEGGGTVLPTIGVIVEF
jgi:TonB-dependent receptor-like protein/carboxypeptidase-like protein